MKSNKVLLTRVSKPACAVDKKHNYKTLSKINQKKMHHIIFPNFTGIFEMKKIIRRYYKIVELSLTPPPLKQFWSAINVILQLMMILKMYILMPHQSVTKEFSMNGWQQTNDGKFSFLRRSNQAHYMLKIPLYYMKEVVTINIIFVKDGTSAPTSVLVHRNRKWIKNERSWESKIWRQDASLLSFNMTKLFGIEEHHNQY